MTKFSRIVDVLDLFSETDTLLTAEEIAEKLQVSRPTAFRYAKELNAAGFLANYSGRYSLGARIITLDYRIRRADPVLKIAEKTLRQISDETGCDSIFCRMYNDEIINVHHEASNNPVGVSFGRGRPLPLFKGSASKVLLALLPATKLHKLYEKNSHLPEVQEIALEWPAFKRYFAHIRKAGFYISMTEIDEEVVGIAVPVYDKSIGIVGAISLVMSSERLQMINPPGIVTVLKQKAQDIATQLIQLDGQTTSPSTS